MITDALNSLKSFIKAENPILEGFVFEYQNEGFKGITDARDNYFHIIRKPGDLKISPANFAGCDGHNVAFEFDIIFKFEKCINVDKAFALFLDQISTYKGVTITKANIDANDIYKRLYGEDISRDLNLLQVSGALSSYNSGVCFLTICEANCC